VRLAVNEMEVDVQSWASKDDLRNYLGRFEKGLLLEESDDAEREFFSAAFRPIASVGPQSIAVGMCSEGHGISPEVLLISPEVCLFGLNSEIVAVRPADGQVIFRKRLDFLFHALIPIHALNLILVIHETGAVAITTSGDSVWEFSRDVVERFHITDNILRFDFMDSELAILDLASGREQAKVKD
jgi:hypothetical protein